jgi:hypothetical protein
MTHCPYIGDFIRNQLPEYYGRSDVLYQTDYERPIDRLPWPTSGVSRYEDRMADNSEESRQWRESRLAAQHALANALSDHELSLRICEPLAETKETIQQAAFIQRLEAKCRRN